MISARQNDLKTQKKNHLKWKKNNQNLVKRRFNCLAKQAQRLNETWFKTSKSRFFFLCFMTIKGDLPIWTLNIILHFKILRMCNSLLNQKQFWEQQSSWFSYVPLQTIPFQLPVSIIITQFKENCKGKAKTKGSRI